MSLTVRTGTAARKDSVCPVAVSFISSPSSTGRALLASSSVIDEWAVWFCHVVCGHRERGRLAGGMELSPLGLTLPGCCVTSVKIAGHTHKAESQLQPLR